MLSLLLSAALAAPPEPGTAGGLDPALQVADAALSRATLDRQVAAARALLNAAQLADAKATAHAASERGRATSEDALLDELERIWSAADGLERSWAALEGGEYRAAGALAGALEGTEALDDERGRLSAHAAGLVAISQTLEQSAVALAWARFDVADAAAHAAALEAWSLYLDGLLTEPQLQVVEARAQDLRDRAGAPIHSVRPGARGVATLAIQYTDMAGRFSPELYAFTRALTYIEGTEQVEGYWTEVGNRRHPESTRIHPGALNVHRFKWTGFISDAYGRYQMLSTTWAAWAEAAGVPVIREGVNEKGDRYYDMDPEYQDLAVLCFLQREGIEELLLDGNIRGAVNTWAARQWSSVPGGSQPNQRTWRFYEVYKELLAEERSRAGAAGPRPGV